MLMPYSPQAAMTSSSAMEPPGCAMYSTPTYRHQEEIAECERVRAHVANGSTSRRTHATHLGCVVDAVAEGEEGVAGDGHTLERPEKLVLFRLREHRRRRLKVGQPLRHLRRRDVPLDVAHAGVDAVLALDAGLERQALHLRVLAEVPHCHLAAGQLHTVNAALLAGAHADHLAVLGVPDGVGLRVLDRDGRQHEVALGVRGQRGRARRDLRRGGRAQSWV